MKQSCSLSVRIRNLNVRILIALIDRGSFLPTYNYSRNKWMIYPRWYQRQGKRFITDKKDVFSNPRVIY